MDNKIKTVGQTKISLEKQLKTIEFGGYNYPIIDIDYTKSMDKEIKDYCEKTLMEGEWCKSFSVTLAFLHYWLCNHEVGIVELVDSDEQQLLYEGFQDYAWHNMPKKYQRYIDSLHSGLFLHICHNYVPFTQIVEWFNKNILLALKNNNDFHTNVLNGAKKGNTACC